MLPSARMRRVSWVRQNRGHLAVFAAALVIRLIYNLAFHPPLEFATSDMVGYLTRADRVFDVPWTKPDPRSTFFPYGTHVLVFVTKWVFGRENGIAIGSVFALLGAATASLWYATARRLLGEGRWIVSVLGGLFAAHVPMIMLGSFVLSEAPFACALAAATFLSLRFFDEGGLRDAAGMGLAFALAMPFRPQVLLSAVGVLLVLLLRRGATAPSLRRRALAFGLALAPLLLVAGISAARLHHHTGRWGIVSSNAAFNYTFGRCHCSSLSPTKSRGTKFEPPSFSRLKNFESKNGITPIVDLDPAIDFDLEFDGYLWDQEPAYALAKTCVERTGKTRQVKYAATHLLLLWAYNLPWPTVGVLANVWAFGQIAWLPGALVGIVRSLGRKHGREALLAVHVWALLATAIVFFGEARLRVPYDGVLMILAAWTYTSWITRVKAWRAR